MAWIKRLKKPYSGKSIALKNAQGEIVNALSQADAFATYLSGQRWKTPSQPYASPTRPPSTHHQVNTQPVTQKELSNILAKVKNNKAPGHDDIPAEAFK